MQSRVTLSRGTRPGRAIHTRSNASSSSSSSNQGQSILAIQQKQSQIKQVTELTSSPDTVQIDIDEHKTITEYVIDGLDCGPHLCNSALGKYEFYQPDGSKALSMGQLLTIPLPLSINTFDGFDEDEDDAVPGSDDEWPHCSKLYSPDSEESKQKFKVENDENDKDGDEDDYGLKQLFITRSVQKRASETFSGNVDHQGSSYSKDCVTNAPNDENNVEIVSFCETKLPISSEKVQVASCSYSQVTTSFVDYSYLTKEYGIKPEVFAVCHAANLNNPEGPFGPYGPYGPDWFLIPHYPNFASIESPQEMDNILKVDPAVVENEARQSLDLTWKMEMAQNSNLLTNCYTICDNSN